MLILPLDPAIYPHLNIYPAVTDVSKPQQSTPASPMSIGAKATDIHPTFCYPSLVICESPSRKHRLECSYMISLQILRCTHGSTSILPLPVKSPDHCRQCLSANHEPGQLHMRAQNCGSGSQPTMLLQFRSYRTT